MRRNKPATSILPDGRTLLALFALIGFALWTLWVTHRLVEPDAPVIVQVRLAEVMRDFVDAEARRGADANASQIRIARFLAASERAVADMAQDGRTILMAEAVLSKTTPDATAEFKARTARRFGEQNAEPAR